MNNVFCTLSILLFVLMFTACPLSASSSADSLEITVPPGGYAWSLFAGGSRFGEFEIVNTAAPGPLPSCTELLPDSALMAIELCPEWLRDDLETRFTDLLFEVVESDTPLPPAFADVNADGLEDLVLYPEEGNSGTKVFLAPNWTEATDFYDLDGSRRLADINNDDIEDSASVNEDGLLTVSSGGDIWLETEGFDFPDFTGTALGDVEGDGLLDIVLGTGSGNIIIYRNRGTIDTPCFLPFETGSAIIFPMNSGAYSSPAVYYGPDSVLIAAIGTQQNGLNFFTSSGGGSSTHYWEAGPSLVNGGGEILLNVSPVEADLNGETILICGTRDGTLYKTCTFSDSLLPLQLAPVPGTYPVLAVALINNDRYPDLIAGTMEGPIYFLPGRDGWFEGSWERVGYLPDVPSGAPAAWKNGLVFGSRDGSIRYYVNAGDGTWNDSTEHSPFQGIDVGEYSVPDFADINGDGRLELIVGNSRGSLTCFKLDEDALEGNPIFVESFSWNLEPNSAVSDVNSYYSRYFPPFSVFRAPTGTSEVNAYAGEIIRAQENQRDEIAFCVANTPTDILRSMCENSDSDLFTVNAGEIYEMAEKLDYVRLSDSAGSTVCSLRTEQGWIGLSRDNYYRFIVHPRILFEIPARINTDYWCSQYDSAAVSLEEWLNFEPDSLYGESTIHLYWREFIPSDSTHLSRAGRRTLEESMRESVTYEEAVVRLCNFQSHSQPEGLMTFGYSTNDLQPLMIYRKAYGSCGEQSILQTALCRAFFIPAYVVGCRGEDHQWNQYLDPATERWNHWDVNYGISGIGNIWVSGEGVNHSGKTISTISAFGPNNEVWPVTRSAIVPAASGYMPADSGYTRTAEVQIQVTDPSGVPVEGAMVLARSHWENANSVSEFNYTDEEGACTFRLGWEPNGGYTIEVVSPFGSAGSTNISFNEDKSYFIDYTVPCIIPQRQIINLQESENRFDVSETSRFYPVPYFSRSLYSIDDENDAASYHAPGWTLWRTSNSTQTVVFMDAQNFRDYRNGLNCSALSYPFIPESDDACYAVLDNRNSYFTWREFHIPLSCCPVAEEISSYGITWLEQAVPCREPAVDFLSTAVDPPCSDEDRSWVSLYTDIRLMQDDPGDPLTAGYIIGPFKISAGERSLEIGSSSDQPGLDMDMFLFADHNSNISVDGMSECIARSTTPTSNESISLLDPDTAQVYWIYLHGWQVPEDGAEVDLGLSIEPLMLQVHSLDPTGYLSIEPASFSFIAVTDTMETGDIYVLSADTAIVPEKVGDRWVFDVPSLSFFDSDGIAFRGSDGTLIDILSWNVILDSDPPDLSSLDFEVDSASMKVLVEASCFDERSGIVDAVASIGNLENVQLAAGEDSTWSCRLDALPFSGESAEVEVTFSDAAGNRITDSFSLELPQRPNVIFSCEYPTGTVYEHRPVLQVYADFVEDVIDWNAAAVLSDSSNGFVLELTPFVIDGSIIHFKPGEPLDNGSYTATVSISDEDGSVLAEHRWSFSMDTMVSTY